MTKMFQRLHDYMVDPELLVCVLIDEVTVVLVVYFIVPLVVVVFLS